MLRIKAMFCSDDFQRFTAGLFINKNRVELWGELGSDFRHWFRNGVLTHGTGWGPSGPMVVNKFLKTQPVLAMQPYKLLRLRVVRRQEPCD